MKTRRYAAPAVKGLSSYSPGDFNETTKNKSQTELSSLILIPSYAYDKRSCYWSTNYILQHVCGVGAYKVNHPHPSPPPHIWAVRLDLWDNS